MEKGIHRQAFCEVGAGSIKHVVGEVGAWTRRAREQRGQARREEETRTLDLFLEVLCAAGMGQAEVGSPLVEPVEGVPEGRDGSEVRGGDGGRCGGGGLWRHKGLGDGRGGHDGNCSSGGRKAASDDKAGRG